MNGEHPTFLLPPYFEYSATFIWAVSGAVLGARQGFAILGVLTTSLVSAAGGGLLRDGLFLQGGPPALIRTPDFLLLIFLASALVMLFGRTLARWKGFDRVVTLVDAVGLGAYAVVGMTLAMAAKIPWPGVVVVGMANAVGGGILRDLLLRRPVGMFEPGTLEQAAALIGCLLFLALDGPMKVELIPAAWITIATVFAVRLLALRLGIQSPSFKAFQTQADDEKSLPR